MTERRRRIPYVARAAHARARENGHDMEPLQDDTEPGSYIAMCRVCRRYLVFDKFEAPHAYGGATLGRCPETPYGPVTPRHRVGLASVPVDAHEGRKERPWDSEKYT